MKKMNFQMLEELIDLDGVSGNEENVRAYIEKKIKPYVDEMHVDRLGNLICHKKGKKPSVMLAAHMDEIGLMVKRIDKEGRIYMSALGGITTLNIVGQTVGIRGKKGIVKGIVTTNEINNDYDITELPDINKTFVDTGLKKKELEKRGVGIGSYLTLERTDHRLGNPDYIAGKALDDRVGCFLLLHLAQYAKTNHDIYYVFTVQEEVGLYGAKVSAYAIDPDLAIAIDVANANDTNEDPTKFLGRGPVLTIKDDEMIGNTCLNDFFKHTAKKNKIPIQLEVSNFGTTDALTISISKEGIPTTALGVCLRNIHTTHSIGSKKDIEYCKQLLEALLLHPPMHCMGK